MELVVKADGHIRAIYIDSLELAVFGQLSISRASHVEPDSQGCWHANLSPVGGPVLGPFSRRYEALAAEVAWLEAHWLCETA
jgi:hypothetical protein